MALAWTTHGLMVPSMTPFAVATVPSSAVFSAPDVPAGDPNKSAEAVFAIAVSFASNAEAASATIFLAAVSAVNGVATST